MFLGVLNIAFLNISNYLPHLKVRKRSIQIAVIRNFVVISNAGIKRFDCISQHVYICLLIWFYQDHFTPLVSLIYREAYYCLPAYLQVYIFKINYSKPCSNAQDKVKLSLDAIHSSDIYIN